MSIGDDTDSDALDFDTAMAHFYRGEMDRTNTWRQRMDETTYWAITLMAAILTWAFSSEGNPHYLLLVGIVVVTVLLGVEARRYRGYDIWRSRLRTVQENVFAANLDSEGSVESSDWRAELGGDLRNPTPKLSVHEAVAHRLRRVYLPLLIVLLLAWCIRVTMFEADEPWPATAAIGAVPGVVVVAAVALFYAGLVAVTLWPGLRHVKGEIYD